MMRKLLPVGILFPVVSLLLLYALMQTAVAEAPRVAVDPDDRFLSASPSQIAPATLQPGPESKEDPLEHDQTVLLWPKALSGFVGEYPSWSLWLESVHLTRYAVRDELLVSVRAIASQVPDLTVETDEPDSDLIVVSGNVGAVWGLMDRLRDHPLLARVTEDALIYRDQARSAWEASASTPLPQDYPSADVPPINIRNSWVANLVWGASTPQTTVTITLTRDTGHTLTITAQTAADGLYYAYPPWNIRAGDVLQVDDGLGIQRVTVPTVCAMTDRRGSRVSGEVASGAGVADFLEVVVGQASRDVPLGEDGQFSADFGREPLRAGEPGFVALADGQGVRTFQPFSVSIVRVRRDTSWGLPWGSSHVGGVSTIVEGSASPEATLVVTATHPGGFVVTRTVTTDQSGEFTISVDRIIQDGDTVEVFDGLQVTEVPVPVLEYHVDGARQVITGTAPAGITTTLPGAPHSMQVTIGWHSYVITTTTSGRFFAELNENPYLAGLLGTLRYTTPAGDEVYKPLFAADPLVRGSLGDWRADIILGQPDFSQVTFNEVVSNHLFNPGGVYVDRSVQPNRVYVYDAGNSRLMGLSHLGTCEGGANAGSNCTPNSDCPGSRCLIDETRPADLVFGQASFNTSACNGDSGYQVYPDASMATASTLCGQPEETNSVSEAGSRATMAADSEGNLYLTDFFNNRVVRYDSPFTTDTTADQVWGQADFSGISCNRGIGPYGHTDAKSLCLSPVPGWGSLQSGVAVDSVGNLWVADTQSNRVLRFPLQPGTNLPAPEADLVLGQPDFTETTGGTGLNQMERPAAVRVNSAGVVYVADGARGAGTEGRVLVFQPPLSNGMPASALLGESLGEPTGLEIDPDGGIWVNDCDKHRLLKFVDGTLHETVDLLDSRLWGGLGVDRDGNLLVTGWDPQQVLRFAAPAYLWDSVFLRAEAWGAFNQTGPRGLQGGHGLEVTHGQLIYGDRSRMLFWNNPWSLTDYQPASGVVGEPDLSTRLRRGSEFMRMRADKHDRLWVIYSEGAEVVIQGYRLPLETGASPEYVLGPPLPLKGGEEFSWGEALKLSGIAVQENCDCLWLSDADNHRVFRIRDATTEPVVDIVLGQLDASGNQCNQGRGRESPSQDSLCRPGPLAFDGQGNLFVADHNLEADGNFRLLEFDSETIPDSPPTAVFGIPATRVFGRNGSFTDPNCLSRELDPMCGPWEPAFDSQGRMVIGFNGYLGPRFPMVYQDPLVNPLSIAALGDFHSMPLSARFDQFDNLYILDHNRNRILIYRDRGVRTYAVTGTIRTANGDPLAGVQLETVGYASSSISDAAGMYMLTGLITGTYIVEPSKTGYRFEPITRTVQVPGAGYGHDFVGYRTQHSVYLPAVVKSWTPGAILFHDDFDAGQAPLWSPAGGNWTVENGEYSQSDTGGVFWSWAGETGWTDYEVGVRMRLLSSEREASLGIRSPDVNNTYYFCLAGGADRLTIAKIINGNEIYNVRWTPWVAEQDRWYNVRVVVQGDRMQCYLDGQLIFDYLAPDMPKHGRIGLRTFHTNARFDDVVVTSVSR